MKQCCALCEKFSGRARDKSAALFRSNRGYCDAVGHPGGRWNVIQGITRERSCARFRPVDGHALEQRVRALIHYGLIKNEEEL